MATATATVEPTQVADPFPDVSEVIAAQTTPYAPPKPGERLPFSKCRVLGRIPPSLTEAVEGHNAAVTDIASRYAAASAFRDVNPAEVSMSELVEERELRREALLTALQDSFHICDFALQLYDDIAVAWRTERERLLDESSKVRQKAEAGIRKVYGDEDEQVFAARVNGVPIVVKNRQQAADALEAASAAKRFRKELIATREQLAVELTQLADFLRS